MNEKKRFWIHVCILILICIPVFLYVQNVLHYRWPDDTYSKLVDYAGQPQDSIDVAVFGTSEMYAAYAPVVTYREQGITGFNFAVQNRSAVTTYYQFRYMLKHQTPKLVVCDFVCLFDNALPETSETIFRRIVDTMPDRRIRLDLIREICRIDPSQEFLSWYFPVFRYHSMWEEITAENFKWDSREHGLYNSFQMGAQLNPSGYEGEPFEITPDLWDTDRASDPIQDFSVYYYDKMIEECREKDIEVVCILTPKVCDAAVYEANFPVMQEYFASRNVKALNYNTYEQISRMDLSPEEDYADEAHLNARGSIKFSKTVAQDLKELFPNLPDRRQDAAVSQVWDRETEQFSDVMGEYDD